MESNSSNNFHVDIEVVKKQEKIKNVGLHTMHRTANRSEADSKFEINGGTITITRMIISGI